MLEIGNWIKMEMASRSFPTSFLTSNLWPPTSKMVGGAVLQTAGARRQETEWYPNAVSLPSTIFPQRYKMWPQQTGSRPPPWRRFPPPPGT